MHILDTLVLINSDMEIQYSTNRDVMHCGCFPSIPGDMDMRDLVWGFPNTSTMEWETKNLERLRQGGWFNFSVGISKSAKLRQDKLNSYLNGMPCPSCCKQRQSR